MTKINPAEILSKRLEWPNVKTSKLIHLFTSNIKEQLENKSVVSVYMFGVFYKTKTNEFISFDSVSQQNILYPPKIELNFASGSNHSNIIPDTDKTDCVDEETFISILSKSAKTSSKEIKTFLEEFFDTIFDLAYFEKDIPIENFGSFYLENQENKDIERKLKFTPDESFQNKINIPFSDFQPVPIINNDLLNRIHTEEKKDITNDLEEISASSQETTVENNIVESAPPAPIITDKDELKVILQSTPISEEERKRKDDNRLLIVAVIVVLVIVGSAFAYLFIFNNNSSRKKENYAQVSVTHKNKSIQVQNSAVAQNSTIQTDSSTNNTTRRDTLKTGVKENVNMETNKITHSAKKVTLTSGQSLRSLALEHLGHGDFWVYIYLKNKDKIKNPNVLPNGSEIIIPSLSEYNINPKNPKAIDEAKDLGYEVLRKLQ